MPGRRGSVPSCAGRRPASSAPTRSSSTRTSGSSRRWTARCSGRDVPRTCAQRSASCPSTCARATRPTASPTTGRRSAAASARSSSGRSCAATGARDCRRGSARRSGSAELFEGWVRDEPGWELCAPRRFSVVCFRRDGSGRGERGDRRTGQPERRAVPLAHAAERALRDPARSRERADDRGGRRAVPGRPLSAARGRFSHSGVGFPAVWRRGEPLGAAAFVGRALRVSRSSRGRSLWKAARTTGGGTACESA